MLENDYRLRLSLLKHNLVSPPRYELCCPYSSFLSIHLIKTQPLRSFILPHVSVTARLLDRALLLFQHLNLIFIFLFSFLIFFIHFTFLLFLVHLKYPFFFYFIFQ